MTRHRFGRVAVAFVCLVLLAGCAGVAPPTDRDDPTGNDVRVSVSSDADRAYVLTVGVAPANHTGFAVELANGTVREYPDVANVEALPDAVVSRTVSVRPFGDAVQTRTFRWDGPQGATVVFRDVPRNATVYYSVGYPRGDEPMRTVGLLTCGPAATMADVSIRVDAEGYISVGNHCLSD
ncbi:hypothetical protein [Halospeciosus flavus]|uniref:Uncharacterized protein n=1 Tax=Halospeciosus flavus TaxID=3032283 RepID=A0ABD5Z5H4_9EURY|nr:hypothetical protein [Halospeciosus flavus]